MLKNNYPSSFTKCCIKLIILVVSPNVVSNYLLIDPFWPKKNSSCHGTPGRLLALVYLLWV